MAKYLQKLVHCFLGLVVVLPMVCSNQLLQTNKDIYVPIGREVYLTSTDLKFYPVLLGEICRVEVVSNEPMTQRVGIFEPQIFDCNFRPGLIKYTHFGSPLLKYDEVKFWSYKFEENETVSERFTVHFNILNIPYNVTQIIKPLIVKEFFGLSNPINNTVVQFKYNKNDGAVCKARFTTFQSKRPSHGQVVVGTDKRPITVIKRRCDDFLKLGLRYEHQKPPSPNIDYIMIIIEVSDPLLNGGELFVEWIQLSVLIEPGFPNLQPKASFSSMYLMDVDQFILTTITPSVLSALDGETPAELLIFNISRLLNTSEGSIVHLSDHSRSVTSFRQADVNNYEIAYKPPSRAFKDREMFEVVFNIFDEDFTSSDPVTLHIAVRSAVTSAPRVSVNTGLILLEGQSRSIRPENLEIVDSDNINDVKVFVMGGLAHGRLEVDGMPGISFTQQELKDNKVVYYHDDSDTIKDSIQFRIYDGTHSTHTKFPISIIPKDDNIPALVINVGIKVEEYSTTKITPDLLSAHDQDTSDEFVVFLVTRPPAAGVIWKKFLWEMVGTEIKQFTQRDINKGVIHYHHSVEKLFTDEFEVNLQDMNEPPNKSPPYKVSVVITPAGNDPPKKNLKCSLYLEVSETDIGVITKSMLHYQDSNARDGELKYVVTSLPRFIGPYAKSGAGKLVSLADQLSPVKDPNLLAITSFTQEEINHHKIGYLPPMEDIGPYPLYLQFAFSVTDKHKNTVTGQLFNITLLPVNNQVPQLHAGELLVDEGSSTLLSTNEISVYDPDTLTSELQISLFTVPLHGSLRRSGQTLRVGDLLSLDDILLLLLEYVHDGSESHQDSFKVGVNDGLHFASGDVKVKVEPVDDEMPVWKRGLLQEIKVEEGGSVQITSQALAATDIDTGDTLLHFILTEMPKHGIILLEDRMVSRFTQEDVMKGKVHYKHNGQEIGPNSKTDSLTVIVTDRAFPRLTNHPSQKLLISITPKNSHPPRVSFRKSILVEEGQTAPITEDILSASDDDTMPAMLEYIIFQQPQHGLVENIRPHPEYEKSNKGKRISTFTQQDIAEGFINYVQSEHRGTEPESDEFKVYVTDGVYNSSVILVFVTIVLRNDEEPFVTTRNITVLEGGIHAINSDVISVTDHDYPGDILSLYLKIPPLFGSVVQNISKPNGPFLEFPFLELPIDRFYQNVIYHHDDSENFQDHFTLIISDGVHTLSKTIYVEIQPINDQAPKLVKNIKASIKPGGNFLISSALLLAVDEDSFPKDILYSVVVPPQQGNLQKRIIQGERDTWRDFKHSIYFTQQDANLNLIRYIHKNGIYSKDQDAFSFIISDGAHNSSIYIYKIALTELPGTKIDLLVNAPTVKASSYAIIDTNIITISDDNNNLENILIQVIRPPKFGNLELLTQPGIQIDHFQFLDIIGRHLIYNHTDVKSKSVFDSFSFTITNGYSKRNATLNLMIDFPKTEMFDLPVLNAIQPIYVYKDGDTVINEHNLNSTSLNTPAEKVVYVIVQGPQNGILQKNRKKVTDFTQADINEKLIAYIHTSGESTSDFLLFEVTNKQGIGYIVDGKLQTKATKLDIFIRPRVPLILPHVTLMEQMEYFDTGRSGFVLTTNTRHSTDNTSNRYDLTYTISEPPQYGYLVYRETGEPVNGFITQQDISNHRVTFVINGESLDVTNDSLTFRIVDKHGNLVAEQRLELQWAIIYFAYPEYAVCEDAGNIDIEVLRAGHIPRSSFVTVKVIGISADEGQDFISSRGKLIQFDPGETSAVWKLQILDDNLEETNIEQIQISLTDPINAVISKNDITLISIHDKRKNECPDLPAPVVRISQEKLDRSQSDVLPDFEQKGIAVSGGSINTQLGKKIHSKSEGPLLQVCNSHIYGLLRYNYSTEKLYRCDGVKWLPWEPHPSLKQDSKSLARGISGIERSEEKPVNGTKEFENNTVETFSKIRPKPCRKGWKHYNEKCYRWFKQQMSWFVAEESCNSQYGGHLTAVHSRIHNEWLIQLAKGRAFWIGLHIPLNSTDWVDASSRALSYSNWKEGFPRRSRSGNIKLKCVVVKGSGHWINRNCEQHKHSSICVQTQNKAN